MISRNECYLIVLFRKFKYPTINKCAGARNWGATEFHEVEGNSTFETELRLKTVDQIIGAKKISLMKVDCEGCEWAAIKG